MKKRWTNGKDGKPILKVCSGCGYINCDSMYGFPQTISLRKMEYRKRNELCIGCGQKQCKCKNKGRY